MAIGATLDEFDLREEVTGSDFINEDVLQTIFQIDRYPQMFLDSIGSGSASKSFHEWTTIEKGTQNLQNKAIDGAAITANDAKLGERVGNRVQLLTKRVSVSFGAVASDTIGRGDERAFQMEQRMRDMRQDLEGIMTSNFASIDPTQSVAGQLGGFPSWIEGPTALRGAGLGADGGYNPATKIVDAATPGTARALTQTLVEDAAQACYDEGANPTMLMSTTTMIRRLSTFMFDSSARVATLTGNTSADNGTGALTAKAAVNVFITSFNVVLSMVGNRDMVDYLAQDDGGGAYGTAGEVDVFVYDPSMVGKADLRGMTAERQGITGSSEDWQMTWYTTLEVNNRKSHSVIADIDSALAVTA